MFCVSAFLFVLCVEDLLTYIKNIKSSVVGSEGVCQFPEFLFPAPRGRRMTYVWTTEARYRRAGSQEPDTELEVVLRGARLLLGWVSLVTVLQEARCCPTLNSR